MVLLNQGANKIATTISPLFVTGMLGSATTFESSTDTDLGSPIAATEFALDVAVLNNVIRAEYSCPPGVATGEDITEFAIYDIDGLAINRKTNAALIKGETVDYIEVNTWRITQ